MAKNPAPHRHKIVSDNQTIEYTPAQVANALNWISTPVSPTNVCGGYYKVPSIIANFQNPGNFKKESTTITTRGPIILHRNQQQAQLEKDIVVKQPGRLIKADHGYIVRDLKTHKIDAIELIGHISLEEQDKHIVGTHGHLNLTNHYLELNHAIYHFYRPAINKRLESSSWGEAKKIVRQTNGIDQLTKATYSTSAPTHPSWVLHASHMTLNKTAGWGHARNMYLSFYHVPIFYSPYFSFPLDQRRKSGFLMPVFAHSDLSGYDTTLPYYLNLAPNYDDTFYTRYLSLRGFMFANQLRYLTSHNQGSIYLSDIPSDKAFNGFKNHIVQSFPKNPTNQIFFNQLNKEKNNRYFLATQDKGQYGPNLTTDLQLNYVSDPYYFQDFGSRFTNTNTTDDQLLNQAKISYKNEHWSFTTLGQIYQTLHPINLPGNPPDQFRRLPEFDVSGDYPNAIEKFDLGVNAQWVNFSYQSLFTKPIPTIGQRVDVQPYIDLPFTWASGYITPQVILENTNYQNRNLNTAAQKSQSRTTPITDISAGLYFDRSFTFLKHHYKQTLEPKLFYLYVPYQSQQNLPVYDTVSLPFSYTQLYATNAFTGIDRLQNANQLTFGLSSSIYDADNGNQKLNLGVGVIDYFANPKVCLTTGGAACPKVTQKFSPIAAEITYYPWTDWSLTGQGAWSTKDHQIANTNLTLTYDQDNSHILSVGYNFIKSTSTTPESKLINGGLSWQVFSHWHVFNYIYYNIDKGYAQNFDAGLEYDTCGWALRFVGERTYGGIDYVTAGANQKNQFNNTYYVQLELKGLGSTSAMDTTFAAGIPGYTDPFGQTY